MAKVKGTNIEYSVKTFRAAGLEARWTRNRRGQPIIAVRDPDSEHKHQRDTWWVVTTSMVMEMAEVGIREGFDRATLLGAVFSIAA